MKNPSPSENLRIRIDQLKKKKALQEKSLNASFKALSFDLSPGSPTKNPLQNPVVNREVQTAATGTALKVSARYLAFKLIGRFGGPVGAVAAAIVGELSDQYMDKTTPKMLKAAGKIFKRKKREATAENEKEADRKE